MTQLYPQRNMRYFIACILAANSVFVAMAQTTGGSLTEEQRQEIIRLAIAYPASPYDITLDQQATTAVKVLTSPEFRICTDHLPWLENKKYKYSHKLSVAYYLGGGAYVVQHGGIRPSLRYYPASLAAAQTAIHAYQSLRQQDPGATLDKMDDWIAKQQPEQFPAYLHEKCPWPALNRPAGPTTVEEKQRFLEMAYRLQQTPLDPALRPEVQELLAVMAEATDFTVLICTGSTPWMAEKPEYKYGPELLALDLMAMSAYILQNPITGKEGSVHNRAGLTATLRGYEAILKQDPGSHSKALDDLLLLEKQGRLDDWFHAHSKGCTEK
jgi:hypothetical protein